MFNFTPNSILVSTLIYVVSKYKLCPNIGSVGNKGVVNNYGYGGREWVERGSVGNKGVVNNYGYGGSGLKGGAGGIRELPTIMAMGEGWQVEMASVGNKGVVNNYGWGGVI